MRGPRQLPSASLGVWSGRLFLWPGRALYVGLAADTAVHAHHAIHLCVGLGGNLRLRSDPRVAGWRWYHPTVPISSTAAACF